VIAQQLQDYSDLLSETDSVVQARFGAEIVQLLFSSPWSLGSKELHQRWKQACGVDEESLERKRSRKWPLKLDSSSSLLSDAAWREDGIILGRYNDEGGDDYYEVGGYNVRGGEGGGEWDGSGESPTRDLSFERAPWDYAESSSHDFSVASVGLDLDFDDDDGGVNGEFGGMSGGGGGAMEVSVGSSSLPIRSVSMEESVSRSQFEVKTLNFFK